MIIFHFNFIDIIKLNEKSINKSQWIFFSIFIEMNKTNDKNQINGEWYIKIFNAVLHMFR